jgi:AcrR family transcriptional regulator
MVHQKRRRSLDLLWGRTERRSRGPKPGLTVEAIADAAIALADAEGLAALTMGRLANTLDVTTMALYRYVPAKEELIDLISDRALDPPPRLTGTAWRAELGAWARANLGVIRRHPWLLEAMVSRVSVGPNWLEWVESALRALANVGLSARERLAVVVLVDGHVRAAAQIELGATATRAWAANFGEVLNKVRDDQRYAALAGAVAAGGFDPPARGTENTFEFGLQRLLDGIEAFSRVRRRRVGANLISRQRQHRH